MTTQHTPKCFGLPREPDRAWPAPTGLRKLLGILLIVVGSLWLGLSVAAHMVEVPLPTGWVNEPVVSWITATVTTASKQIAQAQYAL